MTKTSTKFHTLKEFNLKASFRKENCNYPHVPLKKCITKVATHKIASNTNLRLNLANTLFCGWFGREELPISEKIRVIRYMNVFRFD